MSRVLMLGAAFCAAVGLLGGQPRCLRASETAAEQKIEEALASPTRLEFQETPLQDVVDFLKDHHGIEIQFDKKAMNDVGIDTDTAISRSLKNISLRSALELMLPEHELTYLVENEVLLITTKDEAGSEKHMLTKVYPVADLITRAPVPPGAESRGEPADYDSMIEMITSTVAPTTWDDVGGPGAIAPATFNNVETLVISQTYHVHRKIAALLEDLRKVAGRTERPAGGARRAGKPVYWPGSAATKKVEKALRSTTSFQFRETPLVDVIDFLRDHHGITIQIDTKALADVGIRTDMPITKTVKGISLRAALQLVLEDLDLTWVICNEVLLITTAEERDSEELMLTKVYPVADLAANCDRLAELIRSIVGPRTWGETGGPGSITAASFGGVPTLVVSQTDDVHEEIAAWLVVFRKVAATGQADSRHRKTPHSTSTR